MTEAALKGRVFTAVMADALLGRGAPALGVLPRNHQVARDALRQRHGLAWNAGGAVFVSRAGTPLDGAPITGAFKQPVSLCAPRRRYSVTSDPIRMLLLPTRRH